ncbi:transmembrane channel-like protein 3 [Cydia amplana]|uniref:transmembrane channel-like protein 3 n=1 Tax=Cydia amplana TaxID=1869771 RepID=UPI002FE541EB
MEDEIEEMESRPPSARRNFSLRNNAARQVAINFMPSRQLPGNTIRLKRNASHSALLEEAADAPDSADRQADIIVHEMEQHSRLMEDNPEAEELRREALRDLPQGLTMKRHVRAKLSASVSLRSKSKPISLCKRFKYRMSFLWKRTHDRFRDFIFSIELWYEPIRSIEGHFGSAVGSYFYFLRWLFMLDALLAVMLVAFVVVPQLLHDETSSGIKDISFLDFVSGKGALEDSLLFYGHYHTSDVAAPGYSMPLAYFFTMLCLYLMFFALLCYRTALSYRRNFIETARIGGMSHVFASKVFCSWDFGITTRTARALHANSIYNEFKELLNEQNKKRSSKSFCTRFGQRLANIVVTALVLAFIVGVEYGFLLLLQRESKLAHWEILVSLGVTVAVTICPLFFALVVKLEYYKPRTAVYVTLARTCFLDIGTLMLLLYYWSNSGADCWETSFGQEAYRLVLLDAIISLVVLPVIEFLRALIFKLNPKSRAPEFNIVFNSLTIIYNQGVLWFGMLFSPLLVVAVALKFLCLFYVKRECALRACQPARKIWRAAQTQTVLYMLVTMSLFSTLFGIGTLFLGTSSHSCGPFQNYETVFSVFTEGVLKLSTRPTLRSILVFLTRPGVIGFLVLTLCVLVYYMRAKAKAQHSMVEILRHMLVLQAKDKDFLLNAIAKVSKGEWMYSPKPEDPSDSHTWKYLNEVRKPSNAGYHFDASRLSHSMLGASKSRPNSYAPEKSKSNDDGDTDNSSFSWQGSSSCLNKENEKKWI